MQKVLDQQMAAAHAMLRTTLLICYFYSACYDDYDDIHYYKTV